MENEKYHKNQGRLFESNHNLWTVTKIITISSAEVLFTFCHFAFAMCFQNFRFLRHAGSLLPPEGRPSEGRLRRLPGRPLQLILQRPQDPPGLKR